MRARWHRPWRLSVPGLALATLAACSAIPDVPLDPVASEASWRARTLHGAELAEFLCRNGCAYATGPLPRFDLRALTLAAVFSHPDLDVARAQLEEARAAVLTAGAHPNPNVSVELEPDFNKDPQTTPWTIKLVTEWTLETGGRRDARLDAAQGRAHAAELRFAQAVWEARSHVRAALLEEQLAAQEAALLQDASRTASQVAHLLEQRQEAGEAAAWETSRARDEAARDELAATEAASRAAEARVLLAQAVGVPVEALDNVLLDWPELERPPVVAALSAETLHRSGLLDRLDVRAALADYDAAQADLQLEAARRWPNLTLGPGYTWENGANRFTFVVGALDVPILDLREGPIGEARARREAAAASVLALQARVIGQTDAARERYSGASAELATADQLADEAWSRARSARRALELGAGDALELALADDDLLLVRHARLDALRRTQAALGDLEDAVQRPLLLEGEAADALAALREPAAAAVAP